MKNFLYTILGWCIDCFVVLFISLVFAFISFLSGIFLKNVAIRVCGVFLLFSNVLYKSPGCKLLLELLASFLIADIIICLILLFSESGISFLEVAITIGLSIGGYFLCFLMLFALFSAEFQVAFSGNVIAQLIGTFIGMIGCLAKVHEGTVYLLGFVFTAGTASSFGIGAVPSAVGGAVAGYATSKIVDYGFDWLGEQIWGEAK